MGKHDGKSEQGRRAGISATMPRQAFSDVALALRGKPLPSDGAEMATEVLPHGPPTSDRPHVKGWPEERHEALWLPAGRHDVAGKQVDTSFPVIAVLDDGGICWIRPEGVPAVEVRFTDGSLACATPDRMTEQEAELNRLAQPPEQRVNIPRAIHHLRRAANALHGDALRPAIEERLARLTGRRGMAGDEGCLLADILGDIAGALDLDHNAKGASADVRAAIEALR